MRGSRLLSCLGFCAAAIAVVALLLPDDAQARWRGRGRRTSVNVHVGAAPLPSVQTPVQTVLPPQIPTFSPPPCPNGKCPLIRPFSTDWKLRPQISLAELERAILAETGPSAGPAEDGRAWHFSMVVHDDWRQRAEEVQLLRWCYEDPELAKTRAGMKCYLTTPSNPLYSHRTVPLTGGALPALIVQDNSGFPVYVAAGAPGTHVSDGPSAQGVLPLAASPTLIAAGIERGAEAWRRNRCDRNQQQDCDADCFRRKQQENRQKPDETTKVDVINLSELMAQSNQQQPEPVDDGSSTAWIVLAVLAGIVILLAGPLVLLAIFNTVRAHVAAPLK